MHYVFFCVQRQDSYMITYNRVFSFGTKDNDEVSTTIAGPLYICGDLFTLGTHAERPVEIRGIPRRDSRAMKNREIRRYEWVMEHRLRNPPVRTFPDWRPKINAARRRRIGARTKIKRHCVSSFRSAVADSLVRLSDRIVQPIGSRFISGL